MRLAVFCDYSYRVKHGAVSLPNCRSRCSCRGLHPIAKSWW